MERLIDANLLTNHLDDCIAETDGQTPIVDAVLRAIKCAVEQMPTVDAVPVVRCKDCDFYGAYKIRPRMCALLERDMLPSGFCSEAMHCVAEVERHYYAGFADAKMDGGGEK